jgi:hypothetical protein
MILDKRKLIIVFLSIGIMFFFIGIATNIIMGPTTDTNRLPQQVSSVIKLTGMGFVCISLLIGGIFVNEFPLETRALMIIFGFAILALNIFIMSFLRFY